MSQWPITSLLDCDLCSSRIHDTLCHWHYPQLLKSNSLTLINHITCPCLSWSPWWQRGYLSMFVMVSVVTERQAKWDRLWWMCICDQELYQTGIEAYYDEEWMTAVQNIEQSIPEYFKEYRRCLALCDEPYDQRVFAVFHQQITSSNIASRNKLLLGTDERFCYIALLVNSCQSNVMFNEDKCLRLGLSWLRGQTKARRLRPRLML